jgi:hypothetical protein
MTTLTIQQSEDYRLIISVESVPALPGHLALKVQSQWLGAVEPEGVQVRFATTLYQHDALRLANAIIDELG